MGLFRMFGVIIALLRLNLSDGREFVAYVFAGSARSFILPVVRRLLRKNLIEAFCPPEDCDYDIFVRVSSNDNTHTGIDAMGTLSVSSSQHRDEISLALRELEQHTHRQNHRHTLSNSLRNTSRGGHMYVKYYEIGSKVDYDDMVDFAKGSLRHRIYRELDAR
jgi:hypothetical protein